MSDSSGMSGIIPSASLRMLVQPTRSPHQLRRRYYGLSSRDNDKPWLALKRNVWPVGHLRRTDGVADVIIGIIGIGFVQDFRLQ